MKRSAPPDRTTSAEISAARDVDLSLLMNLVGFGARTVLNRMLQRADVSQDGFRPGELSVLATIRANPGIRHGVLADALAIKRSNLTTLIAALTESGLVERRALDRDVRSIGIYLTGKGAADLDQTLERVLIRDKELTKVLSAEERETLLRLLAKLAAGLAADDSTAPPLRS